MAKSRKKGSDDSDVQSHTSSDDTKLKRRNKKGQKGRQGASSDEEAVVHGVKALMSDLSEKRTATRESALNGLQALIRRDVHPEELDDSAVELANFVISSIKKGNPKEAMLAGDLLTLMFISLQGPCQEVLDEAEEVLARVARTHKNEAVKAKICQALAMGSFACGQEASDAWLLLSLVEELMLAPKATAALTVPALRAWALLVSSMPDAFIFERVRRLLSVLDAGDRSLLEHDKVEVRVAAAEAASVVYESCWRYSPEEARKVMQDMCEEEEEEGKQAVDADPAADGGGDDVCMSDLERLEAKMEALGLSDAEVKELGIDLDMLRQEQRADEPLQDPEAMTEADKQGPEQGSSKAGGPGLKRSGSWKSMKQTERSKERSALRMARATMQGGAGPPLEKIRIRAATIEISTWRHRTWLNALRASLESGLQAHMAGNSMLHELFDICAESANMTALEMRQDSLAHRHLRAKNSVQAQVRERAVDKARRERQEMCQQSELMEEGYQSG